MVDAMKHRGPDDFGIENYSNSSLGMTRLSIQDVSAAGHQPMANEDRSIWIVYNGELYNAPERREELTTLGQSFFSRSDTEVILRLYERYGDDCLNLLEGIFALAIYDLRRGPGKSRVLLARDPMGVKPLLVSVRDNSLIFASEMKAMLASDLVPRHVDADAFRSLLTNGAVAQPKTMIKGVQMIPPAHFLKIENGKIVGGRYWRLGANRRPELSTLDYPDQVDAMRHIIDQTVRSQLISDVPVGAFLSGGVDSATLVASMARAQTSKVKTFSIGFSDPAIHGIDETPLAAKFARHLGTDHHEIKIGAEDVGNLFDDFIMAMDQPSIDGFNTYVVSQHAAKEVKVAISGTGGDDLFMGYPWHAAMLGWDGEADGFIAGYRKSSHQFHGTLNDQEALAVMAPELRQQISQDPLNEFRQADEMGDGDRVERLTALTLRGYTANQLLRDIDAMSMAHSLEVRVPYLDRRVIDAGLSLPLEAKISRNIPKNPMRHSYRDAGIKKILIDVARPYLPEGFDLVRKQGFGIPFKPWLEGPLRDLVRQTIQPTRMAKTGLFHGPAMNSVLDLYTRGRLGGFRAWLLLVTQHWFERMDVSPG